MGSNFHAGHPTGVFGAEEGHRIARQLSERFGSSVPLGTGKKVFCLPDEIGWSWWSDLQKLAKKKLGAKHCPQILCADAWTAVYVDAQVDREVIRSESSATGEKQKPAPRWEVATGSASDLPPELRNALDQLVKNLGARSDEQGGLQVGNLPLLFQELSALLQKLGTDANAAAVQKLMTSYSGDRAEDDPEIQCLRHAWLTAKHALEHRSPMWLVK